MRFILKKHWIEGSGLINLNYEKYVCEFFKFYEHKQDKLRYDLPNNITVRYIIDNSSKKVFIRLYNRYGSCLPINPFKARQFPLSDIDIYGLYGLIIETVNK